MAFFRRSLIFILVIPLFVLSLLFLTIMSAWSALAPAPLSRALGQNGTYELLQKAAVGATPRMFTAELAPAPPAAVKAAESVFQAAVFEFLDPEWVEEFVAAAGAELVTEVVSDEPADSVSVSIVPIRERLGTTWREYREDLPAQAAHVGAEITGLIADIPDNLHPFAEEPAQRPTLAQLRQGQRTIVLGIPLALLLTAGLLFAAVGNRALVIVGVCLSIAGALLGVG
ncbi:MAG: hypothetical protein WD535_02935, partial [Thermaerobacterales bacterium]